MLFGFRMRMSFTKPNADLGEAKNSCSPTYDSGYCKATLLMKMTYEKYSRNKTELHIVHIGELLESCLQKLLFQNRRMQTFASEEKHHQAPAHAGDSALLRSTLCGKRAPLQKLYRPITPTDCHYLYFAELIQTRTRAELVVFCWSNITKGRSLQLLSSLILGFAHKTILGCCVICYFDLEK